MLYWFTVKTAQAYPTGIKEWSHYSIVQFIIDFENPFNERNIQNERLFERVPYKECSILKILVSFGLRVQDFSSYGTPLSSLSNLNIEYLFLERIFKINELNNGIMQISQIKSTKLYFLLDFPNKTNSLLNMLYYFPQASFIPFESPVFAWYLAGISWETKHLHIWKIIFQKQ